MIPKKSKVIRKIFESLHLDHMWKHEIQICLKILKKKSHEKQHKKITTHSSNKCYI